jgi:type VI secretion system protein ImpM
MQPSAGLFGKLPAKRDFIGANASRRFLEAWEPWLQAAVATSKQMLGDAWIETYNRAPIIASPQKSEPSQ